MVLAIHIMSNIANFLTLMFLRIQKGDYIRGKTTKKLVANLYQIISSFTNISFSYIACCTLLSILCCTFNISVASANASINFVQAPSAQQKFRHQGFPHYYSMMTIVGGNQATGVMRRTSRQGPPTEQEEEDLEELLTGHTVGQDHRYASNMDDINRIVNERAAYKRKHGAAPQGSDSASKRTKSSDAADTFLQAATEASLKHIQLSEAKLKAIHINDPATAANNDKYNERDVQKAILKYKNEIKVEQYVKAFQQLGDARWRVFFMETPDEMKLGLLQSIDLFSPKVVAPQPSFQPYYVPDRKSVV